MKNFVFTRFASAVCFVVFAAYGFYQMRVNTETPKGTSELASTSLDFETPESCGADRNYFEEGLKLLPRDYSQTRKDISKGFPQRSCVTYIMKTFMPLDTLMKTRGVCTGEDGKPLNGPSKGNGYKAACITESYVNSVYNSLVDVSDCMNIPMKEILPKLYNESGLHINTLGPSFDTGVGQLTKSALFDDVFEPYKDNFGDPDTNKNSDGSLKPRTNQQTTYEYYLQEMAKSSKPSCQRILRQTNVTNLIPADQKDQILCDSKYYAETKSQKCFRIWDFENRCQFMNLPENPLRNVLTMAFLYRNNMKNATGITYVAGEDMLGDSRYVAGTPFKGYFSANKYVERLRALGVQHPSQEVLKQAILVLGFNAGPTVARSVISEYISGRENLKLKTSDSDFNFQDTDITKWGIVTNPNTFWKGLSTTKENYNSSLELLKVVGSLGLNYSSIQKSYAQARSNAQVELAQIDKKNLEKEEAEKAKEIVRLKYDEIRKKILSAGYPKAAALTLPEFARVSHAYQIAFKKMGGTPGYISFVADKYKVLRDQMKGYDCSPDQYLKF